jgi:formate-dependent nitrite reductase membrane component NrfD
MNPSPLVLNPPQKEEQNVSALSATVTYYDLPVLKQPVWIWTVPLYFFTGGVAGVAMVMGAVVQSLDGRRQSRFAELCHWTGAIGGVVSSVLLTADLGRPSRFLFMLRVLRPSSPMSIGSWLLACATPLAGGSALLARAPAPFRGLSRAAGIAGGILGMPLAGYTAVLLANSAVPVWLATRKSLPLLFGASAATSLASVFELLPLSVGERAIMRRFGLAGRAADLVTSRLVEHDACSDERVGVPLKRGLSGALWKTAKALTAASLVLSLFPGESRVRRRTTGILGIAGGLALRFAIVQAGKASTRDPRATFRQQARLCVKQPTTACRA